ncbi:MAG: rRNA maturation RNase YbeY [Actinomycetota bacterium]
MTIEVNNESGAEVDEVALVQLSRYVLDSTRINPMAELSVVLLDSPAMAALHEQWMDIAGPTDVMAFPMDGGDSPLDAGAGAEPPRPPGSDEGPPQTLLGDVVLCPEVAAAQAATAGHSVEAELHLLCTHGILHLLGYDHGEPDDEREMFELQARIVGGWAQSTGRPPIQVPTAGTGAEVRGAAPGTQP